jgi:hypothetical protein
VEDQDVPHRINNREEGNNRLRHFSVLRAG